MGKQTFGKIMPKALKQALELMGEQAEIIRRIHRQDEKARHHCVVLTLSRQTVPYASMVKYRWIASRRSIE